MEIWDELAALEQKLKQLKKENDRLFASNIELRVNQMIMQDRLNEIRERNEKLLRGDWSFNKVKKV